MPQIIISRETINMKGEVIHVSEHFKKYAQSTMDAQESNILRQNIA